MPETAEERKRRLNREAVRRHRAGTSRKNRPQVRGRTRSEYRAAVKEDLKAAVDAVKLEQGCIDCGYRGNPVALDFDHVSGLKVASVSEMVRAMLPLDQILAEITKCVVRCAICHRIATHERRSKP